jgi:hypothetical protein
MPAAARPPAPPSPTPRVAIVHSVHEVGRAHLVHDEPLPPDGVSAEGGAPSLDDILHDSASAVSALADAAAAAMAAAWPPWLAELLGGPPDPAASPGATWAAGPGTLYLDGVALGVREGAVLLDGLALAQPAQPAHPDPAEPDPALGLLRCPCARRLLIACVPEGAAAGGAVEWAAVCRDCGQWSAGPVAGPAAAERDLEVLL